MTAGAETATSAGQAAPAGSAAAANASRRPAMMVSRLTARWIFISLATAFAFRKTIASLIVSTEAGSLNGYLWLMPIAAILATIGVARRERTELPIHDRQTDIIVGILALVFALMLQGVLLHRYELYFHLLRIDVGAMWFFLAGSCVILFGLRPVIRFVGVWLLLMMSFPIGYHLSVITFGGNRASAGMASLAIAAAATAVSVGRTLSRALVGALGALVIGSTMLAAMIVFTPNAPLLVFQLGPALLSMVLVGLVLYLFARRGLPKLVLGRKLEPLAAGQIWAGMPLVLVTAVFLSMVNLPESAAAVPVEKMTFGRPLAAPAGWHQTDEVQYHWVQRVYGRDANLIRQTFVADAGNRDWDKFARPREVVVDSTSTWHPFSLQVYPTALLYDESSSRISDPRSVNLGHGVLGSMVTVVDDKRFLTYNLLTWSWGEHDAAQRVVVAAVDNHEADVVFPEPVGGFSSTLRTMISVLFRGNQATWDSDPTFKDEGLLTHFGTTLVEAQLSNRKT